MSFVNTEADLIHRIYEHYKKNGWIVKKEIKIRGRIADLVMIKDNKIALVKVKGPRGDVKKGISQALHYKDAANYSYLAIYKDSFTKIVKQTCQNLGIGLILINKNIEEMIKPEYTTSLKSVQKKILDKKSTNVKKIIQRKSFLDLLFRKSQILILKLFFLDSTKEFHQNDIARKIHLSSPAVSNELTNLVKIGLVSKRHQDNMLFYKINKNSIIFDEMKRIFLKYETFSEILSEKLVKEKIKYSLIYGSFAKGTEKETSDIDLLIVGDVPEDQILRIISDIERNINREINFILWTEKELKEKMKKNIPLIREMLNTSVIMLVGEEDEFKRLAK